MTGATGATDKDMHLLTAEDINVAALRFYAFVVCFNS